jgi:hypothetical protein
MPLIGILYYSGQSRQECCESERVSECVVKGESKVSLFITVYSEIWSK